MNLPMVSMGLVGSVFLFNVATVTTVGAAPSNVVVDPAVAVEITPVANAVQDGLNTSTQVDLFGDNSQSISFELAQGSGSGYSTSIDQSVLHDRTRELMSLDTQEVDSVAARLKEIIRDRYKADTLNIETMSQVDELRQQVAEFESLLARANAQKDSLNTEKLGLQEQLNLLLTERQKAQSEINELASQMESQLGSVQALKSETESSSQLLADKERALEELTSRLDTLTAEKQEAEEQAGSLSNMLADTEQRVQDLQDELANVIAQRDSVADNAATTAAELAEKENNLADLKNRFDSLVVDNEAAKQQQLMVTAELGDKENAFSNLVSELQEVAAQRDQATNSGAELQALVDQKESSIADLQQQVNQLAAERDTANSEIVAVNEMLNQKADHIDELQVKLSQLNTEKESVADQLSLMKSKFDEVDVLAGNVQQERDDLANTLSLLESKATDYNSAFITEKQNHANTRATADALEKDIGKLQQEVMALTAERDELVSEKDHLIATSGDLNGRLIGSERELDTRQRELQAALTSISNMNGQISGLTHERETGRATIANLEGEIASAQSELARVKEEAQVQFLATSNDFEDQRALLTAELADRNLKIENLQDAITSLEAELQSSKVDRENEISVRDKQINDLKAEISSLDSKRLRITGLKTQGDQKLGELRAEIAGLLARRDIANDRLGEYKTLNNKLTTDLDATSKQLKEVTDEGTRQLALLKKKISTLETGANTAENEIRELDNLNSTLEAQLAETRNKLESVTDEGAQRVMALQTRISEFEQLNADLTANNDAAAAQINSLEHVNHGLQAELEGAETRHIASLADIDKLQTSLSGYESELTIANRKLMELETAQRLAEQERDAVIAEAESLRLSLTNELNTAKLENISVQKARADNSIPIRLGNADFFAPGSAKLTKAGGEKLTKLAEIIESYDNRRIVVEGHTDNVPIGVGLKYRFESNWELSVARSAAAVRHMQFETDIDPRNLSAAGYGEFHPVASNDNPDGRQQNRRVEVVLYPVAATKTLISEIDE